jgi:vacuolar-type H+-ATPase subunit I/STV1
MDLLKRIMNWILNLFRKSETPELDAKIKEKKQVIDSIDKELKEEYTEIDDAIEELKNE